MARAKVHRKHSHNGKTSASLQMDLKKLKSALSQATRHAKGNARKVVNDSYGNLLDKSSDVRSNLISYTRKKPMKTLGFAVLAGLVIGLYLRK